MLLRERRVCSQFWKRLSRLFTPAVAETGVLVAVIVVATIFRFYRIEAAPPGLQHDEVFQGNFAIRILNGEWPIFFDLNGGEEPLYMYLVALSFLIFGRTLFAIRIVSIFCGLVHLVFSCLLARQLFGQRVALLTTAGLAVSFWHIFDSRVGLRPISLPMMQAIGYYLFWLGLQRGSLGWFLGAGLFLGGAFYTYTSGPLALATLLFFAAYLLVLHRDLLRRHWQGILLTFGVALLVFTPEAWHIIRHPTASTARARGLSSHLVALANGDPIPVLKDTLAVAGMFGFRGDPEWRYNLAGRPVFDGFSALLFYIGIGIALARLKKPEYGFLLTWLPVNLAISASTPSAPSTLRALGAITAIYILPALTWDALWQWAARRWGRPAERLLAIGVVVVLVFNARWVYRDYFVVWTNHEDVRTIYRADFTEAARYLAGQNQEDTICMSAQFAADLDQEVFYFALGQGRSVKWFDGRSALVLPSEALPGDVTYVFPATGLLDEAMLERFFGHLPPAKKALDPQGRLAFLAYRLGASEMSALRSVQPQYSLAANLGGQLELLGYDLPLSVQAGQTVRLVLYYRIPSELGGRRNYSFFTHLVDERDYLWSQDDAFGYPTSNWYGGDMVVQWLDVFVPPDAPPRSYHLKVGLFDQDRGQPFPVVDEDGSPVATAVTLEPLTIGKAAVPPAVASLGIPNPLQARVGDSLTFLGYDVSQRALNPGQSVHVSLYWQAMVKPESDYLVSTYLVDEGGKVWPQSGRQALDGDYPTSLWEAGQVVRDRFDLMIDPETPRAVYELRVGLYDEETKSYLPVMISSEGGLPSESIPLGQILVRGRRRQFEVPSIENPLTARFGEVVSLLGYDLEEDEIAPGEMLHLTLYWRAQQEMDVSYTVFVHLLDGQNRIWGQRDSVPDGGQYPTTGWLEGEVVEDGYEIPVDPAAPAGEYLVEVGLYDAAQPGYPRLPVLDEQDQITGDRVLLREVRIKP